MEALYDLEQRIDSDHTEAIHNHQLFTDYGFVATTESNWAAQKKAIEDSEIAEFGFIVSALD